MPIIEVKNLSKKYEYYRKEPGMFGTLKAFIRRETLYAEAIKNVSFSIEEGEMVGFLGPNGAGKTTTLKILSGILHPTGGEAKVLGFSPHKREKAYQKQFSLVMGQKNQLLKDLPAYESFILYKEIYEIPDIPFKKSLDELVGLFDIKNILDIPVRKLSLGQRMKCELAAALLHSPKVLFLDEPTIGLDVVAQKNTRDFIKKYNKEKKTTIVLTSHYMDDIKELCNRVIIINTGSIVCDGGLVALIKRYDPYKLLKVTFNGGEADKIFMERFGTIEEFDSYHCVIRVPRDEARSRAAALLSSPAPVDDILIDEMDIDNVVREIFKMK